jgi:beta-phosphoglucomutase-like phosphatase (HAD superfamily)
LTQTTWLFLDFDNTLMATEQYAVPSLIARFNDLYRDQAGRDLTYEEFKQHFHGQARENLCTNLSKHFNITVDYPTLYESREWRMMQHLQKVQGGIPMAANLIEALTVLQKKGFKFAFVSNNPIQRGLTAMRFADNGKGHTLANFFGANFFEAGDIQKPKPDVYLRAMEQLGATPTNSFAVEDSMTGATSAIDAGITTFAFTGYADKPDELAKKLLEKGCVAAFNDWQEFEKALESAQKKAA